MPYANAYHGPLPSLQRWSEKQCWTCSHSQHECTNPSPLQNWVRVSFYVLWYGQRLQRKRCEKSLIFYLKIIWYSFNDNFCLQILFGMLLTLWLNWWWINWIIWTEWASRLMILSLRRQCSCMQSSSSDFRGLQSILKCGGSPSTHGCLKCWFRATKKAFNGTGKTIYAGHRVFLPPNHPLRAPLTLLHNTTQERPGMLMPRQASYHLRWIKMS